jgi:sporulation protein YhbH
LAILQPDYDSTPRGRTDAARHREKIRDAIRANLPEIIGEEAIITREGQRVVRVPVRGLKSYRFLHSDGLEGGFGSGQGKKGSIIAQRSKEGRPGQAGDQPGVDYLETEIELEALIEMMLQDLGLPNLREKQARETLVPQGWKYESIEKSGIRPRLDKLRSLKEAIKRTEVLVGELMRLSGRPEVECREALERARGSLPEALRLLRAEAAGAPAAAGQAAPPAAGEAPRRVFLDSPDLRFRTIERDVETHSNAVVLAMMDVSGSMGTQQKYLARSFFFWMVSFLRTLYRQVQIRFIAHTTEAKLVDEEEFFHKGESGGTYCHSAHELASRLVAAEYPTDRWNVYSFHFSDGEDWSVERTLQAVRALLDQGIAALGYGEIQSEYSSSALLESLRGGLDLELRRLEGFTYYEGRHSDIPLLGLVIRTKEDLYPALRAFLKPERQQAGSQ